MFSLVLKIIYTSLLTKLRVVGKSAKLADDWLLLFPKTTKSSLFFLIFDLAYHPFSFFFDACIFKLISETKPQHIALENLLNILDRRLWDRLFFKQVASRMSIYLVCSIACLRAISSRCNINASTSVRLGGQQNRFGFRVLHYL